MEERELGVRNRKMEKPCVWSCFDLRNGCPPFQSNMPGDKAPLKSINIRYASIAYHFMINSKIGAQ